MKWRLLKSAALAVLTLARMIELPGFLLAWALESMAGWLEEAAIKDKWKNFP